MAMASFCSPYQGGEKKKSSLFFVVYCWQWTIVGDKTAIRCFQTVACNLESILSLCLPLTSFFFFFLNILFREELAMRLDLTEARVQVSGSLFIFILHVVCVRRRRRTGGGYFMSSIKCPWCTVLDNNRWYASLIEDQRLGANLRR